MSYINIYKLLPFLFLLAWKSDTPGNSSKAVGNDQRKIVPGVIITLDDNSVQEWILADSLLQPQRWRATFFVSKFQQLDKAKRLQLLQLQQRGHELGFHGDNHIAAVPYIEANAAEKYIANELSQVDTMKKAGMHVRSFAYPSGSRSLLTDSLLFTKFSTLRGVTNKEKAAKDLSCFFNGKLLVDGIGMEQNYKYFSLEYLQSLLDYARKNNTILVVYGHKPVATANPEKHEVEYSTLEFICKYVNRYKMKFYTMSDLVTLTSIKK